MLNDVFKFSFLWCIFVIGCTSYREERSNKVDSSFIGKGTNEIAIALLQGTVAKEEDMVFSPFGYSAIMAIFAEGAGGVTKQEITTALHFPDSIENVRESYKKVLERFVGGKNFNSPEFKNWFYIYKNYSVKEEFQNLLRKYYLTEVKSVNRPEEYLKESPIRIVEKPDVIKEKKPAIENSQSEHAKNSIKSYTEKAELKPTSNKIKISESEESNTRITAYDEIKKIVKDNDSSTMKDHKKSNLRSEGLKMKAPSKIKLNSTDNFSGMTDSYIKIKNSDERPQMIIFNGLYYRGEWEQSFEKRPAHDSRPFYKSEKEKVFISTIHSQGVYNTGYISNLDCRAIELPYKGNRYSLLILVPSTRNGLTKLISDLSGYSFNSIYDQLTEKLVDVCLPSFEVNTISKPISSLQKLGLSNVTSIFSPQTADLSGISNIHTDLYVEELVQMVTFKVETEYSKTNFLTAATASSRSNAQAFQVNQPFLFYLKDNLEDIIIVNGKIIDPTPKPNFYFS